MELQELLKILSLANQNDLAITGRYGVISARPDGMYHQQSQEPTYRVDAQYQQLGNSDPIHARQNGFRFSTVCCLCAAVCMGEANVNLQVISAINEQFACKRAEHH